MFWVALLFLTSPAWLLGLLLILTLLEDHRRDRYHPKRDEYDDTH